MRIRQFGTFVNILALSRGALSRGALPNTKKLCRDCRHYIANEQKCRLFGDVNIVSGKEYYDDAREVRCDNNKCGEVAKAFEKNNYKFITVPYYFLKEYWTLSPLIALSGFYIFSLMKLFHQI
jgi:hypothetical protein